MFFSPRNKRILLAFILLAFCGLGAKLYLGVTHAVRQVGLAMRLEQAINEGDPRKVEAVLKQGANPNKADDHNPLLLAMAQENEPIKKLLLGYGASPSLSLLSAGNPDEAKALLALGADVNARVGYGDDTPLMHHATAGDVELVKFLLQQGADATLKSEREAQWGQTVMQLVEYAAGNRPDMAAQYRAVIGMLKQTSVNQPGPK